MEEKESISLSNDELQFIVDVLYKIVGALLDELGYEVDIKTKGNYVTGIKLVKKNDRQKKV